MKKLITLLIAFMLTASINSYASFTDENGTTRLSYEVTPAPGDYVNQVDGPIKIMFTDPLQSKEETLNGKIYGPNGNKLNYDRNFKVDSNNSNMYTCEYGIQPFIVDANGYGTYVIEVDATWVYGSVNGATVFGSVIRLEYNVTAPSYQFKSATPASNEKVNSLSEILINYNTNSVLTGSAEVEVVGADGVTATLEPTSVAGQIKATLSQAVTAEGTYSIAVPKGAFKNAEGNGNDAVTLNYTVEFPTWDATEILANPENGAKKTNLNAITLTFPENIEIVGTDALTLGSIAVTATKTGDREVTIAPTSPVAEWATGQYALVIPANYFKGTSKKSPELNYTWEVVAASLAINPFHIYKGYTQEITIDLTNGIDFSGFQADLTLPEGLRVVGEFTLNRGVEGNHELQSNVLRSTGKTRLLCYPKEPVDGKMPNLTGNSGALVTFTVEASAEFAGDEIKVDGIVFSTAVGEPYMLQNVTAAVEAREYATEIIFTNAPEAAFETGEVTPEGQEFTAAVNAGAYNKGIEWSVVQSEEQPVITFIDGIITAVGVGEAVITATALGAAPDKPVTKSCTVTVVYTHAEAIAITTQDGSETVAIEALDEYQLTATATPTTNKDIVWESSKPGVVTVDQTGKLTGVTVGDAVITAMIKDAEGNVYVSDTINVTVASTPATSVVIMTTDETPEEAPESANLHVTGTATYKAKVNDLATNKAVKWESNDPTIAEVAYKAETGIATVTAKAVGTAVITVMALGADPEGAPVVDTITINVLVTNAAEIEITTEVAEKYESADEGDEATTFQLEALVGPDYTTYKNVAWVSSNPNAATVDQEGNVTIGSTPGVVTITAIAINNEEYDADKDYSEYVKAEVSFAVVHTFAESVAIDQQQESIPTLQAADNSNNKFQLTAVVAPATNKDIVWEVRYDENNTEENPVVSVDQTGLVTALRTGQATVVARIEETEIIDSRVIKVGATPGDVNDNGTLDVFDINLLAAYILEADNLPENFVAAAADYNNDGFVNVADIITLSNDVLTEEDTPAGANARMYRTRQYADSSNSLFIEDFTIVEGETKQIAIMLNNNAAFSAFQADIYLPEGLEIVEATLSDRKADHTLASAMRNNGSVRLLSYSMGLNSYAGSEGELVYLTVKATDNFVGDFQIEIDNIKFATVDFAEYYLEPTVANVAGYTGVESVEGDEIVVKVVGNSIVAPEGAEVYDLNGLRVNAENLAKGIYIVKVGNQVVKVII